MESEVNERIEVRLGRYNGRFFDRLFLFIIVKM